MNLLAADIGGTKTILELFSEGGETLSKERYPSGEFDTFVEVLTQFLEGHEAVDSACFAIAGPVMGRTARVTNLPWVLDCDDLSSRFGIGRIRLVNDFYAVAASLSSLASEDLFVIQEGELDRSFPCAVLGAGTGLGEAIVVNPGSDQVIIPTEGGHCDFAPANERQDELLRYLRATHGHVSWERVVSGPGIVDTYEFLCRRSGDDEEPARDAGDVVDLAKAGHASATAALDLFFDCYGAEAGNLALKSLCRAGLYVAGGIGAKNEDRMTDGRFLEALRAKGRFRDLMESIPVLLIRNPEAGLIGAGTIARSLVRD